MENDEILNLETGTKEITALKPATVKIMKVEIQEVGEKKNKKLVCNVKHPDKEDTVNISSVKYETNKSKLETVGLWLNLDEDGKLRKGSALNVLMDKLGAKIPSELVDKESETTQDEKGYLTFKGY